jgi:hypothetical protein
MPIPHFFKLPSLRRLALLLLLVVPVASWFVVKPVRVVAPTLAGVTCPTAQICLDDASQLAAATALLAEAQGFVATRLAPLRKAPRVVFCSTVACADAFGLGARSAVSVGTLGTVIGPRAWKPYYLRHELIHQLQAERLGVLGTLFKPAWFVEGMAYALSDDPRAVLAEPWRGYRARFGDWCAGVGGGDVWAAAGGL